MDMLKKTKKPHTNEIVDTLKSLVSMKFDIDKEDVGVHDLFVEDLGADSLDLVEVMAHLEDSMGVNFCDSDIERCSSIMNTAEVLYSYMDNSGKAQKSSC